MHIFSLKPKSKISRRLIVLAVLLLVGFGVWWGIRADKPDGFLPSLFTGETIGRTESPKEANILNGVLVDPKVAKRRPLAIMVENHTEARPQVGLSDAAIIYEAIAEGGITRFMAVFGPFDSDKIGPVRSARQYYVEWAKGMDALYAHVGGSQDARNLIRTLGVADLDQFRYGTQAYHREPKPGVAIEHTMFTSTRLLYEVANKAKFGLEAQLTPYQFKDDAIETERGLAQTLAINFSTPAYKVVWTYDPATNSYLRMNGGIEHVDRISGERVTAKTLAVATVKRQLKPEEQGTGWFMTTTGSGKARVFLDGKEIAGTWKRPSKDNMIRFYDETGTEITLNRGQLWIEIVHSDVPVTVQ